MAYRLRPLSSAYADLTFDDTDTLLHPSPSASPEQLLSPRYKLHPSSYQQANRRASVQQSGHFEYQLPYDDDQFRLAPGTMSAIGKEATLKSCFFELTWPLLLVMVFASVGLIWSSIVYMSDPNNRTFTTTTSVSQGEIAFIVSVASSILGIFLLYTAVKIQTETKWVSAGKGIDAASFSYLSKLSSWGYLRGVLQSPSGSAVFLATTVIIVQTVLIVLHALGNNVVYGEYRPHRVAVDSDGYAPNLQRRMITVGDIVRNASEDDTLLPVGTWPPERRTNFDFGADYSTKPP
ncbi:hypothetical protein SAICODRAFT_198940 [Saitoella complicata NRRL Y-17804]|nr:uncharacterized protein SAICODRAFT_198940 [Saitoella complicata NRRL Y-17804]ODQ55059.1 hypothetical protein SAICODRAFT_198940 [Saitoella complicata NRRL Y-17804]